MMLALLFSLITPAAANDPFLIQGGSLSVPAGAHGRAEIRVVVPSGTHVYKDMMAVEVVEPAPLKAGAPSFPPGFQTPDPANPGSTREMYDLDVIVEIPVSDVPAGAHVLLVDVTVQGCRGSLCWMPRTERVEVNVTGEGAPSDASSHSEGAAPAQASPE